MNYYYFILMSSDYAKNKVINPIIVSAAYRLFISYFTEMMKLRRILCIHKNVLQKVFGLVLEQNSIGLNDEVYNLSLEGNL